MNMKLDRLMVNILRAVFLGLTYGFLEVHLSVQLPELTYRIVYALLLTLPFVNSNLWIWAADGLLAQAVQDSSFWVFARKLPFQWAWYYPVVGHVPIDDVVAAVLIVFFYLKGRKVDILGQELRRS
jgi:hypothetical protein